MDIERYIAFRKKINFITVYIVDKEKIEMQISKNVFYRQPYSTEWHEYIKKNLSANISKDRKSVTSVYQTV